MGESLVYGWWSGLNKDGAEFESDHPNNPPQPGDVQGGTLIGLNNLLTDFVKVSNTMRCVYIVQNTHGYNVNVSLYNHNNYQQCTNGLVISATETCS
ncbi:MAG: hypothetical protein HWD59_05865 [Coxiellaceae bacterium]|nr:MAG: hypothetical protein HWD59_05865 [Coxiellaceae bacterium]